VGANVLAAAAWSLTLPVDLAWWQPGRMAHTAVYWCQFRSSGRERGCPFRAWWNSGPPVGQALFYAAVPGELEDDARAHLLKYWPDANVRFVRRCTADEEPWANIPALHRFNQ
jgi:hypothetical protein